MNNKIIKFLDMSISILVYAIILIIFSLLFNDTVHVDNSYFGLYSVIASLIIYILNRTIKPLIIWLTLPITALTLGLFYPFINVLILKLTDFILLSHFSINGYIMPFIVAILISIVYIITEHLIDKILERK